MKSFKELSENITELEYRDNGRFHYSEIAGYIRDGFSYLVKPHKEESESLTFGSMVDCLVTEGQDVFDEKYCIAKEFNLSDNQKLVIQTLAEGSGYDRLEDIEPVTVIACLGNYYKNPESQFTKLLKDGCEYYRFLHENQDKTTVDYQMYQDAIDTANVLLSSPVAKSFFKSDSDDIDIFHQLKFNGEYNGIPITCMVDSLYIEHATKKIWPIDLKTTCANYEWEFPKSFIKYGYHLQARLYSYILRQVMNNDDFYKDYQLMDFVFVYVSRTNKNPLIWVFDENLLRGDIEIETKNGNKIILQDFTKPLEEMNEIKETNRTMPLNISKINDVMKHFKDF